MFLVGVHKDDKAIVEGALICTPFWSEMTLCYLLYDGDVFLTSINTKTQPKKLNLQIKY